MAILSKRPAHQKITIDLSEPQGNVFFLMGMANVYGKQLGLDCKAIVSDMKSSDYEHAIQVFDSHFGSVVDLIREEGE